MTNSKLKIKAATAAEICALYEPSDGAKAKLAPEMAPIAFFDALAGAKLFADAVEFLVNGLPKREAVWWACVCIRDIPPTPEKPAINQALLAAENWVMKPSEDNRRAAEKAANAIKDSHAAQWAAMGAFWSGGSLAPIGVPEVKPSEDFTAKAINGSIQLAAIAEPAIIEPRQAQFLAYGRDIAHGGSGRKAPAAS